MNQRQLEILRGVRILKERLKIDEAEDNLIAFLKLAWPVVEHGTPFIDGYHISAIAEHLEACAARHIRKLIINIPPRMSKSVLLSVCFPAWMWIKHPEQKFLCVSYDLKLSKEDSRRCRSLIESAWYQQWWGNKFKMLKDQNEKFRFVNDKTGFRLATSVDAGTTGSGGDFIILDDPNDVSQMNSDAYIENVLRYVDETLGSRMNNPKTGVQILIQQRSNERDVSGHFLAKEHGWQHLAIPMEYEGPIKPTCIGWSDPRTEIGQLMCPERIGVTELEDIKRRLGPVAYSGQYQQHPTPGEGAKFKREWWNFWNPAGKKTGPVILRLPGGRVIETPPVEIPPAFEQVVQAWDMAFKESKDHDLVAGHAWGRVGANCYLLARDSDHYTFPETLAAVRRMSEHFPCPEKLVEDKANGPAVIQTLRNEIPGMIPSPIQGGLEALATSVTGYAEAGNIYLPNPDLYPWVLDFIEQFAVYPRGKHDDDVAAASHGLRRLFDSISNSAAPEFRVIPRPGEPASAQHVEPDSQMAAYLQPHWRQWIAIAPGHPGAALWVVQMPSGALRVRRELELRGADAYEAGRRIAEASLPDIRRMWQVIHATAKPHLELLLERECFAPIEPIGCYAELLETGLHDFEPLAGSFEEREMAKAEWKRVGCSSDMVEVEDAVFDRLRDLLRFQPPDFQELPYNRTESFRLAQTDKEAWMRYMAAVEGQVHGEWPRIKFAASCMQTIAALGTAKRTEESPSPFLRALLIGVCAADSAEVPKLKEVPYHGPGQRWTGPRMRGGMRMAV